MKLTRTRAAYEIIRAELDSRPPEKFIESCLVQYLAVVFYSEMEERISEIISAHLKRFTGSKIGQFLTNNLESIINRTPKSDISKLVGLLGEDFKIKFNSKIDASEVSFYSNVIQARHHVGHRSGSEININEVARGIDAADRILFELDECFED
jgi:RiboL-PSP-HEPN